MIQDQNMQPKNIVCVLKTVHVFCLALNQNVRIHAPVVTAVLDRQINTTHGTIIVEQLLKNCADTERVSLFGKLQKPSNFLIGIIIIFL